MPPAAADIAQMHDEVDQETGKSSGVVAAAMQAVA